MSVQQINPAYIQAMQNQRGGQQLQAWLDNGQVIQKGESFFVAVGSNLNIPDNCLVQDADGKVKTFQMDPVKGTFVERQATQPQGEVVGTPTKTCSVPLQGIIDAMGLPADMQAGFKQFLATKGFAVNGEGAISFDPAKGADLNAALKEYAALNPQNFVDPNAQHYVQFTPESDAEFIADLSGGSNPAIADAPGADGRYAVKDRAGLEAALTEQIGETVHEPIQGRAATLSDGVVTTTVSTVQEDLVGEIPGQLRTDKSQRKDLEQRARAGYQELVNNADPEMRDAIDLYIAESKYDSKINARMQELRTDKANGRTNQNADIIELYIENYTSPEQREGLNQLVNMLVNSEKPEDQQAIMDALRENGLPGMAFDRLDADTKRQGALLAMAKAQNIDPNTLLRLMATNDVMSSRSSEQVLKDDQWFVEQQAKDFVKNQQTGQTVENTVVHFNKQQRKAADKADGDNGKIHTDIGDKGRKLFQACPQMLGVPTDHAEDPENGYVKAADGKVYQFDQERWQNFMRVCCDPTTASDEELGAVLGEVEAQRFIDGRNKIQKEQDRNMTLQEGRQLLLSMNLPKLCDDGKNHLTQFAEIIGNSNGKIDNKELNALRNMVKSAGYSVDGNSTYGKRLLHVLKNTGIGAAIGIGTAGLGSLFAGAINFAAQVIPYSGKTDPQTLIAQGGTYSNTAIVETDVNGRVITQEVQVDVTVPDQELTAPGQEYSGTVQSDPQSGNTHLRTGVNGGIIGGIGGAIRGLSTMSGVHERGRNTDDVFSLRRNHEVVNDEPSSFSLEVPQFTTVETRRGQKEVGTDPLIHSYTTVIAGVKQELMACYPDAPAEFYSEILNAVAQANGIEGGGDPTGKLWSGRYTDANGKKHNGIYVPPSITLSNGVTVEYKDNHTTATRVGSGGGGHHYDVHGQSTRRTVGAQGTIRR